MSEKLHSYYNKNNPIERYCTDCGSTDVELDATCKWDAVKQEFVDYSPGASGIVADVLKGLEDQWCNTCSKKTTAEVRYVTDLQTLAKIAIHKEGT